MQAKKTWREQDFLQVEQWRSEGLEWDEIGPKLGVSGNAARIAFKMWKKTGRTSAGTSMASNDSRLTVSCQKVDSERALFVNDWHIPFHDADAIDLILRFASWFKPHKFFIVGDYIDCYTVSRFDKDPARIDSAQEELDQGNRILRCIRRACGSETEIIYLDGNHEFRWTKYVWQHPELNSLRNLRIPSLLNFDSVGIKQYYTYQQSTNWHGLLVEHGNIARKHSAATAKGMLESRGVCGLSGHTHRLATYYHTDNSGVKAWYENGCGCQLTPSYIIGVPNWCQGFSIGYSRPGKKRFAIHQLPILDHVLVYGDREWRV